MCQFYGCLLDLFFVCFPTSSAGYNFLVPTPDCANVCIKIIVVFYISKHDFCHQILHQPESVRYSSKGRQLIQCLNGHLTGESTRTSHPLILCTLKCVLSLKIVFLNRVRRISTNQGCDATDETTGAVSFTRRFAVQYLISLCILCSCFFSLCPTYWRTLSFWMTLQRI